MADTAATKTRDLHRSRPYWASTPGISVPAIATPSSRAWDVIIVGTGISGALVAEALTRRKRRVLILDRRPPVRGASLASTAMIQHEIDMPLHRLADRIGTDKAARAWQRSVRAVGDLLALTRRLQIDCQMQAKEALYLAGDDLGHRALRTEFDSRRQAGIPAEYLDPAALRERFGIDRTGAILSPASASANPAQLTAGLLRVAVDRGAEIASPVDVTDLAELGQGVALATGDGRVLTAGHVVFCTGYEYLPQMESAAHQVISTWALASEPGVKRPTWLDGTLVWEASDPYLYFRATPDGRIIAGGEDEGSATAFADPARMRRNTRAILDKLRATLGIRFKPAYTWSAPFGNTTDGLPIIDRVPGFRRAHAVMGFGGNGITWSVIAAQIIAAAVAGKPDSDADLYRFR